MSSGHDMSGLAGAAVPAGDGGRSHLSHGRRIVAALAVTQTIGYGALYYAFSVFLVPMTADLHATGPQVAAAFTLAVLTTAACAPLVGRLLDAHGGRVPMSVGSVLATLALLAWSQVSSLPQLYGVLAVIGVASALVLYEPAFAVIVTWFDGPEAGRRANALLTVTIVAGFASSIFLPLSGMLVQRYGWRTALVVLAVIYGAGAVPLHALVLRRRRTAAVKPARRGEPVRAVARTRPFRLLVLAFTAHSGAMATIAVLLVTYLISLGHSPAFAATVAGLLGVLSVTGRLVTTTLRRRWPAAPVAASVFVLQGAGVALLPLAGRAPAGAICCVLAFGAGFGVGTITLPHLLAERYGTTAYAGLSGRIALFSVANRAAAPLGAIALAQAVGYGAVMAAVAGACALAAGALLAYDRA
ncbi:MFS transporter [Streptosporangium sandarakinum]